MLSRGDAQPAQALLEFAIVLPVLTALLMGIADAGFLITNKAVAAQAVGAAVRRASLLPGKGDKDNGSPPQALPPDPTPFDREVVRGVVDATGTGSGTGCSSAGSMRSVDRLQVWIYQPNPADGQPSSGTPRDGYDACGNPLGQDAVSCAGNDAGPNQAPRYDLPLRDRDAPNESYIGVMVQWDYHPVFLESVTMHFCEFATTRMQPHP